MATGWIVAVCVLALCAVNGALAVSRATAEDGVIRNDTVWRDTGGREIWCNGGHMIRQGDVFYWIGYETARRRPWKINLYSSKNLSDWTFVKSIITKRGDFGNVWWAGRPGLLYNEKTKEYVILFESSTCTSIPLCSQFCRLAVRRKMPLLVPFATLNSRSRMKSLYFFLLQMKPAFGFRQIAPSSMTHPPGL